MLNVVYFTVLIQAHVADLSFKEDIFVILLYLLWVIRRLYVLGELVYNVA